MTDMLLTAGFSLLERVLRLIMAAVAGDTAAQAKLKRVEEVLTDSPTDKAWADAMAIAERKRRNDPPLPPPNPFTEDEP